MLQVYWEFVSVVKGNNAQVLQDSFWNVCGLVKDHLYPNFVLHFYLFHFKLPFYFIKLFLSQVECSVV